MVAALMVSAIRASSTSRLIAFSLRISVFRLKMELVMLGGSFGKDPRLLSELEEATGLKTLTMDVWETWGLPAPEETANGWEAALGLAVRDLL